jgi:hypothetical protein
MNIEFSHQAGPMRLSGPYADFKKYSNFFARLSFADELKNLAPP